MDKQFIQRAKTALCDKWQQSHQKWVEQQQQRQSAQMQATKYQWSLQLQAELATIFGSMSAPSRLTQIKFPSDLRIENNTNDNYCVFRFRWLKENIEKISYPVLNEIKNSLNVTILENQQRLLNTASTLSFPDNEFLIQSYPFTARGFRIIACLDNALDIELVIQT